MNISVMANGIVDFIHPGRGERYIREAGFEAVALALDGMVAERKPFIAGASFPAPVVIAPSVSYTPWITEPVTAEDVMRAGKILRAALSSPDGRVRGRVMGRCRLDPEKLRPEEVYPADENGMTEIVKTGSIRGTVFFVTDTVDDGLISELTEYFAGSGIRILITNRTKYLSGRYVRGRFCEPGEVSRVIERFGKDRLGFCFDTGEANLCGQDPAEMLRALKDVTDAVIVRENDGIHYDRYLPFSLNHALDWGAFFRGMRAIGFDGELIFDIVSSMSGTPIPLHGDKVKEAYRMAEFFRWQIDMDRSMAGYPKRVLFGAGNMCRSYMKDYGKDHPPMFTVDNDSRVWGSTIEGLEIKPPESLKELDQDTAIIVCITYYREVHEQLAGMGIKNPILDYNDQYPNKVVEGRRLEREWTE